MLEIKGPSGKENGISGLGGSKLPAGQYGFLNENCPLQDHVFQQLVVLFGEVMEL